MDVMNEVIVLIHQQRTQNTLPANPNPGDPESVAPYRDQAVMRQPIEPPREDAHADPLWDEIDQHQLSPVAENQHGGYEDKGQGEVYGKAQGFLARTPAQAR